MHMQAACTRGVRALPLFLLNRSAPTMQIRPAQAGFYLRLKEGKPDES